MPDSTEKLPEFEGEKPLEVQQGPRTLGRYEVVGELARGGQGVVYEASLPGVAGRLALKLLLSTEANDLRRFKQEAQVLSKLEHPNLPTVVDLGEDKGHPYMVMELLAGKDLKDVVREQGPLDVARAVKILGAVARTLHYCHQNGIVHRDLKPANVMLEESTGRVVVVDFGLLKRDPETFGSLSQDERASMLTKSGDILGTPAYMAPEQIDPKFGAVGPRTDVYALGATLYRLLTGEAPFAGAGLYNLLLKVMEEPPRDPRKKRPEIPRGLAELCLRAMSKDQEKRPGSAEAFAKALVASQPAEAAKESASVEKESEPPPPARSRFLALPLALGGAILAAIALGLAWDLNPPAKDPPANNAPSDDAGVSGEQTDPNHELAKRLLAEAETAYAAEDYEAARSAVDRSIELRPRAQAYAARAALRLQQQDRSGALEDCRLAIELDPNRASAFNQRGMILLEQEDTQAALEAFTTALGIKRVPMVLHNRATARLKLRQLDGARRDILEALEDPNLEFQGYSLLGQIEDELGHFARAEEAYSKALEAGEHPAVLHNRSDTRVKLGNHRGAIEDLERCLQLSPGPNLRYIAEVSLSLLRAAPEGFTFLRLKTFASGGQEHMVAIYRNEAFAKAVGLQPGETAPDCEFVLVPRGTFTMGSPPGESDRPGREQPQHQVTLKPFLLARTEVTQRVWKAVTGENPSLFVGAKRPVEKVSWKDAQEFCTKTGLRLPSEAEWEYACRAGTTTPFAFGDTITLAQVNRGGLENATVEVASFEANAFGLFDMHGNVNEWCQDRWHRNYLDAPTTGWPAWEDDRDDKVGATRRIRRGGSWDKVANDCRSAARSKRAQHVRETNLGFRPAAFAR